MEAETLQQESEEFWAASRPDGGAWLEHYRTSINDVQRAVLIEAIRPFSPFANILEVGGHCGPNLQRIRQAFLWCPYTIWDLNAEALAFGRHVSRRDGYGNGTTWVYGSVCDPINYPDRAFDVVVTSSVLSVIAPESLEAAVDNICRLADRVVVMQEPAEERHNGIFHQWAHDYSQYVHETFAWSYANGIIVGVRQ